MLKGFLCTLLSLSLVLPCQSPQQSTEEDWIVRGTIALPEEYVSTIDIDGYCYGFTDDFDSMSTYFVIPAGESQTIFEFHVPAATQKRYDFMLEIFPDCGLVKNGMNFGENGTFTFPPHYFYLQNPITDLGTYTLMPAQYITGVICIPQGVTLNSECINGYVRATKPDRSYSTQSNFTICSAVGSTDFSIAVPDGDPYYLSVYLGNVEGNNLYTDELYLKEGGLFPGSINALSFQSSDHPTLTLRQGYTVKGMVTLPESTPGACSIDVFAVDDEQNGNGLTICNLNPGESAPFKFSFFDPSETLRFGYRVEGNAGQILSEQAIYTDGVTFSLNRIDISPLDITNPDIFINFTPTELLS